MDLEYINGLLRLIKKAVAENNREYFLELLQELEAATLGSGLGYQD